MTSSPVHTALAWFSAIGAEAIGRQESAAGE
jgi:hypothetical protein